MQAFLYVGEYPAFSNLLLSLITRRIEPIETSDLYQSAHRNVRCGDQGCTFSVPIDSIFLNHLIVDYEDEIGY